MEAQAVIFEEPGKLVLDKVLLSEPEKGDLVVEALWSGISTGTERLFWEGRMPGFPGMGYPLVPGYETVGEVVDATGENRKRIGERVFVPGSSSYREVKGLFGGAASTLIVPAAKAMRVDANLQKDAALCALAATAYHILDNQLEKLPDLIVGHGILGRLLARIVVALGGESPVIWENDPARRASVDGFKVLDPSEDRDGLYSMPVDVTGDSAILDTLIQHLVPHGEIVLAGFYAGRPSFAFPPAFMKEARFRIAAEWKPEDMQAVYRLVEEGRLSFENLISDHSPVVKAEAAYRRAFENPECLKMILEWKGSA